VAEERRPSSVTGLALRLAILIVFDGCYTCVGVTPPMYSLSAYGEMLADRVRIDAFARALQGAIRPGSTVLEIGTGPGVIAVPACRLGASRVYAIEPCGVIQVAREVAKANSCADKIEFIEDFSTRVSLPVRADVIVSDLRGVLPIFGTHIQSIADARERFLASGGTLIGRKDHVWAAVVHAPAEYASIVDPWERNPMGISLDIAKRRALSDFRKAHMKRDQLLTNPQLWSVIDYRIAEKPDFRGSLNWIVQRDGVGHGILVWFDMELADEIELSNSPDSPAAIYGSAFFPWLEPAELKQGQCVHVDLEARLLNEEYFWRWTTHIESRETPGGTEFRFDQSQLQAAIISPLVLRKAASNFVPQLSNEGSIRRKALELMDSRASLETIAQALLTEFPARFKKWEDALSCVAEISVQNSL
jgi:type I protein arginine methyltransferase